MYAWLDEWYDLTLDDILASEKQMWQQTGTLVQKPTENGKQEVIEVPNNGKFDVGFIKFYKTRKILRIFCCRNLKKIFDEI